MFNSILTRSFIFVRFQVPGFHCWKDATGDRAYLATRHRHLFHVEIKLQVYHDDREVELHDLSDFCRKAFPGGEMGGLSCEMMAQGLLQRLIEQYGDRSMQISISEDGECGAIVVHDRHP